MSLDPLLLSRLQFAWVIAWHILLPAITVGLASFIAFMEAMSFATGRELYFRISSFWTRIFAVTFGMGVVSGVVLPFQIGANWSRYSDVTANIISPLLGYEALMAFFLEAAFLGVLLFGRQLTPRWMHVLAAVMVAAGTLFSTFWILAANSWMQTPAGYQIVDGRFFPKDWTAIVFSPSFPCRLAHTVCAFYLTTGFVVLGVGAWLIRKGRGGEEARAMVSVTLWLLLVLAPLQLFLGDAHGLNTLKYQPAKLAAIEARWETGSRIPLTLFAIPDQKAQTNHASLDVPVLGSLILTHDPNGRVRGLKEWPRDQQAPVAIPFFAFRIMVGIGLTMIAMVLVGNLLRRGGRLYRSDLYLRACVWAAPLGFLAVIAGWTTTEVGRQPWTVYGLLRTSDSVTPSLTGSDVGLSFAGYVLVYLIIYPTGLLLMSRLARRGFEPAGEAAPDEPDRRPPSPLAVWPPPQEEGRP